MVRTRRISNVVRAAAALIMVGASHAQAQSSVTLYGIISTSLQYASNSGGNRQYALASGTYQLPRWGLLGREDLGGRLAAVFRLENGFSITNGSLSQGGRMFGRYAYVGLSDARLGTVTLGRQPDEMSTQMSFSESGNTFGSIGTHIGDNDNMYLTVRLNNSARYMSPSWRGLSFAAQYAFSNADNFAQNRAYSGGTTYQNGPLKMAVAMTEMSGPALAANANGVVDSSNYGLSSPFVKSLNEAAVLQQRIIGAGATYALGTVLFNANYTDVLFNYADASSLRLENAELGISKRLTPALLVGAAYLYTWGKYSTDIKPHYQQVNIGLDYALSVKTDLFAAAIFQRAGGSASYAQIYSLSRSSSHSQTALESGIRVRF
ncbi:porin [Caballeronia sordidicola]|uniref:Outer membrane protein (Porin) n=1 Tax=Caballeronia sordidicola TaxID=196367 RepID=A0A242M983_CABSO|nr:porin [Caballeronia sordidicola]OTP67711.1 Outer membrane protein (porin) [Caballeronia sordidicola]